MGLRSAERVMRLNGIAIDDGFAEAFPMKATRLLITAHDLTWALHAAVSATGMATSVIACGCEAGIERELSAGHAGRPSGRCHPAVRRVGQGTRQAGRAARRPVRDDLSDHRRVRRARREGEPVPLGRNLRFFGDGWQIVQGDRRRALLARAGHGRRVRRAGNTR
jgi:formylmethanofuran--tetrahydromethanopterin N-formyltransferase